MHRAVWKVRNLAVDAPMVDSRMGNDPSKGRYVKANVCLFVNKIA